MYVTILYKQEECHQSSHPFVLNTWMKRVTKLLFFLQGHWRPHTWNQISRITSRDVCIHSLDHIDIHILHQSLIINGKWSEIVNDKDKRFGMQVRECLTGVGIFGIINILCVTWSTCIWHVHIILLSYFNILAINIVACRRHPNCI